MPFDVDAARKAGASDDQIIEYLTKSRKFDVAGALNAGADKNQIIQYLSSSKPKSNLSAVAASRKANIEAGGDIPPGVNLTTPPDESIPARIEGRVDEGVQQLTTGLNAAPAEPGQRMETLKKLLGIVGGGSEIMFALPMAVLDKLYRQGANLGLAGPELEQASKAATDVTMLASALPSAVAGLRGAPKVEASPIVGNETPIPMQEGGKTVDVVPNAPPQEGAGEAIAQKYGATDLGTLDQNISAAKGIPPADQITVGEVPISRTEIAPDGSHKIDLATDDPALLAHEKLHVQAEAQGTPHPPEDNAAIVKQELAPKAEDFEGMEYTDSKTGQVWRLGKYDEMQDAYVGSKSIKTGQTSQIPADRAQASFGATEPIPSKTVPPEEKVPYVPDPSVNVDYEAATGPLPGRTAEAPAASIEPNKATGIPAQGGTESAGELTPPKAKPEAPEATDLKFGTKIRNAVDDAINFRIVQMVTAPITWARNVAAQGYSTLARGLATTIGQVMQKGVQAVTGGEAAPVVNSFGAFKEMFLNAPKNARTWAEIEQMSNEAMTLNDTSALIGKPRFNSATLEKYSHIASAPNRLQEAWFRTGHAINHLNQVGISKTGRTLAEIMHDGDFAKVFTDADVAAAVKEARTVTFSLPGQGPVSQYILQSRSFMATRMFAPFLRFGYNNARWLYTYSPIAAPELFGKALFSAAGREAFAAGDAATMVRWGEMITGTAVFMGSAHYASKVMKDGDTLEAFGKRVNIGPLNPISAYLIAGYIWGRATRKDPAPMFSYVKDLGYLSDAVLNSRGSGSPVVSNFITMVDESIRSSGNPKIVLQKIQDGTGRWIAGYARPLGAINEILSSADPTLADMRDTSGSVWDASIAAVPYVNKDLPKRYGTDYAGPVKIQQGAWRQLTGLGLEKPGSIVNDEMKRLQVYPRYNVFPAMPAYNNDYRKILMEKVDELGVKKMAEQPDWKKKNVNLQRQEMQDVNLAAEKAAKYGVMKDMPEEIVKKLIRIDPELAAIANEQRAKQGLPAIQ